MNKHEHLRILINNGLCKDVSKNVFIKYTTQAEATEKKLQLKHRDSTCPMYNTCSSLGWISNNCSIKCYLDTSNEVQP